MKETMGRSIEKYVINPAKVIGGSPREAVRLGVTLTVAESLLAAGIIAHKYYVALGGNTWVIPIIAIAWEVLYNSFTVSEVSHRIRVARTSSKVRKPNGNF